MQNIEALGKQQAVYEDNATAIYFYIWEIKIYNISLQWVSAKSNLPRRQLGKLFKVLKITANILDPWVRKISNTCKSIYFGFLKCLVMIKRSKNAKFSTKLLQNN